MMALSMILIKIPVIKINTPAIMDLLITKTIPTIDGNKAVVTGDTNQVLLDCVKSQLIGHFNT